MLIEWYILVINCRQSVVSKNMLILNFGKKGDRRGEAEGVKNNDFVLENFSKNNR